MNCEEKELQVSAAHGVSRVEGMLQRPARGRPSSREGARGPADGEIGPERPRRSSLRAGLGRGAGPHPPGLQQQRGLGPLRGQVGRHRLGRRGRPGVEQGEAQRRGAQEQPHHVRGLCHGAEREALAPRTRSPQPAAATAQPAPLAARPPTSGGGSSSPLLGAGAWPARSACASRSGAVPGAPRGWILEPRRCGRCRNLRRRG